MKVVFSLIFVPFLLFMLPAPKKEPMKLGQLSQIAITTSDLSASISFWKKLGFRVVFQDKMPFAWAQMTDETVLIYLTEDPNKFQRLSYFTADYLGVIKHLKKIKAPFKEDNGAAGNTLRAIVSTPDGQEVSIVNRNPAMMYHPTGKTMATMDPAEMSIGEKMPARLGMFGEYCHQVKDLKVSIAFWEKLGFKSTGTNVDPYPWAIMTDGISLIGLHQTTDWEGSALTYFAPDMGRRLELLRAEGITGTEIGMGSDNVIVTTPEGMQLFLFSL